MKGFSRLGGRTQERQQASRQRGRPLPVVSPRSGALVGLWTCHQHKLWGQPPGLVLPSSCDWVALPIEQGMVI